ncbi:MAG: hypothetical protein AABO58_23230 [Acidobacteriota bacterium]
MIVSADESVRRLVDADEVKEVTEVALRKYAAHAGEATVTIHFDSFVVANEPTPGVLVMSHPWAGQSVPIVSAEPWNEPGRPMVGARNTSFIPTRGTTRRAVVRGTYTITDARGVVLEQKQITIPPNYDAGFFDRMEQRAAATQVAKRVAALRTP